MELYLDSVNLEEIKAASRLGYLTGLTTTPTFMVKEGVKDTDAQMLEIARYVHILQVEALGNTAEEIVAEAERLIQLGLSADTTVFKIPVSLEGTRACHMLIKKGLKVNLHLVYTLQQAYMAFAAGATYVCPLVGRLQDQGHDALDLLRQCVHIVERYKYPSKIMFSSVRSAEHVRNALNIGVDTITVPWKILKTLTENHFTTIGTEQFFKDTRALATSVGEIMKSENVSIKSHATLMEALIRMTHSRLGAVTVMNDDHSIHRIFTDGDLRRLLQEHGEGILQQPLSQLEASLPLTIDIHSSLYDAQRLFHEKKVDTVVVMNGEHFAGLLDVQQII